MFDDASLVAAVDNDLGAALSSIDTDLFAEILEFLETKGEQAAITLEDNDNPSINADSLSEKCRSRLEDMIFGARREVTDVIGGVVPVEPVERRVWSAADRVLAVAAAARIVQLFSADISRRVERRRSGLRSVRVVRSETIREGLELAGDGGIGVGGVTVDRLAGKGVVPVAFRWVLGEPEFPHPDHEDLGGSVVTSLSSWSTRPGAHAGCQCVIEFIYDVS